jgi:hypothetical protein
MAGPLDGREISARARSLSSLSGRFTLQVGLL